MLRPCGRQRARASVRAAAGNTVTRLSAVTSMGPSKIRISSVRALAGWPAASAMATRTRNMGG